MVDIVKFTFHNKICSFLGIFVALISIDITYSSERRIIDGVYENVNLCATSFRTDGWIAQVVIVIFFKLKNLNILYVKQSESTTVIYLVHSLFHNQIVVDSFEICP